MQYFLLILLTTLFAASQCEIQGGTDPEEISDRSREKRDKINSKHTKKPAEIQGESSALLFHIIYLVGILFITILSVLATWIILNQYFEYEEPGCKQGEVEEDEEGEDLDDGQEDGTTENEEEVDEDEEGNKDLVQKLPEMDEEINWVWGEEDEEVMKHYA